MKKVFIAFLLFVFIFNRTEAQKTINGFTLPAVLKKDNVELVLNGGGVRKKIFFKLYVAGLYVSEKTREATAIINDNKAEAMRLIITSGLISSNNMSEAIEEGFKKSMNGNTAPLQPKIDAFINTFKNEPINEGDVFELFYLPDAGVKVYKNDKLQNTITGIDFKKALFGIWFSDNSVDDELKKNLLALP